MPAAVGVTAVAVDRTVALAGLVEHTGAPELAVAVQAPAALKGADEAPAGLRAKAALARTP